MRYRDICARLWPPVPTRPRPAEILSSSPIHFDIQSRVTVAATPAEAFAALGEVGAWWDGAHCYSGDSRQYAHRALGRRLLLRDSARRRHGRAYARDPGAARPGAAPVGRPRPAAGGGADRHPDLDPARVPEGTEIVSRYLVSGHVRGDTGAMPSPSTGAARAVRAAPRTHARSGCWSRIRRALEAVPIVSKHVMVPPPRLRRKGAPD